MKRFIAIIICSFVGISAFAEDDALIDTLSRLTLKDLLELKVMVSSLHDETIVRAPSSVTVFTRQQIRNMGIESLEELLNFVPGFQATRETVVSQGYRVGARGLLTPQPSYSILFLIDGQRLNSDLSAGALFVNRYLTTGNIQRVEIIRGPGSALYGSSAFSGVVNIITVRDANEVYFAAGNLNSGEAEINVAEQNDDWRLSAYTRLYTDDGQNYSWNFIGPINGGAFETQDPYTSRDAYLSLSWRDKHRVNIRHMDRELENFFDPQFVGVGGPIAKTQHDSVVMQSALFKTSQSSLDAQMSYSVWSLESSGSGPNGLNRYKDNSSEWQLKFDGFYDLSGNQLRAGLSYRRVMVDEVQSDPFRSGNPLPLVDSASRGVYGAYIQSQFNPRSDLYATLGVRVDGFSSLESSVSPRAALVYTPTPSSSLKLMYGEAFRAPNRLQVDEPFVGNPDLKSEDIRTLEVAWLQDYSSYLPTSLKLQTTATWFSSKHENRIELLSTGSPGSPIMAANIDETQTTSGVELELAGGLGKSLTARAAYTHLPKTEQDPQSFSTDSISFIAQYDRQKWHVNLNGIYRGQMEQLAIMSGNETTVSLDSYWVIGTSLHFNLSSRIKLSAHIKNLSDKKYYSPSIMRLAQTGLENRGRTFMLGLGYQL